MRFLFLANMYGLPNRVYGVSLRRTKSCSLIFIIFQPMGLYPGSNQDYSKDKCTIWTYFSLAFKGWYKWFSGLLL